MKPEAPSSLSSARPLIHGGGLPWVGLGVFRVPAGKDGVAVVQAALDQGYRHVDTARLYGNEVEVGEAVRTSGLSRREVFITSKVWNDDHGYDATMRAVEGSLARLDVGPIDLMLVHWPVLGLRRETWRALERCLAHGMVKAVGVSNYMAHHLEEMTVYAHEKPSANQIEVHPFLQQREVRAWCRAQGVVVEAYSPLAKGRRLDHPAVRAVAAELGRTPAQVMLRWGLERDMVVLPKSVSPERMAENADLFGWSLGEECLDRLDALEEGGVTGWDPRQMP
jgi:diketogulonate reductase-like aldo/keto reductase